MDDLDPAPPDFATADFEASRSVLSSLQGSPEGPKPRPRAVTALQELPFGELTWTNFEKFVLRLAEMDTISIDYAKRYGRPGQAQQGIDIFARLKDGPGYVVYQCKRYEQLKARDLARAVDHFLGGFWAKPGDRFAGQFVFATTLSLLDAGLADAIEAQTDRLGAREPPIRLRVWGSEELSKRLKDYKSLVVDFFGPELADQFLPERRDRGEATLDQSQFELLRDELRRSAFVTTLPWARDYLKLTLTTLKDDDQAAFVRLIEAVGEPPSLAVVISSIGAPPGWLGRAPAGAWRALALMCEARGEWLSASQAWERAAERAVSSYEVAGDYAAAAISSSFADELERCGAMKEMARSHDPHHPRLLIEEALKREQESGPQARLELLHDADAREPIDIALIEANRAIAYAMLGQFADARACVARSRTALADNNAAKIVELNIDVHQARVEKVDERRQHANTLRDTYRRILEMRDELHLQRRWTESAHMLALAVDCLGLLGDFRKVADLLLTAVPEELALAESADVLAMAGLRNLAPSTALKITENSPTNDGLRITRASAVLDAGISGPERQLALNVLDSVIASAGVLAPAAAHSRLIDAMAHGDWSDPAERLLRSLGHGIPVTVQKAHYLAQQHGDWRGALQLLETLDDRAWALPARLRIAKGAGNESALRKAVTDAMEAGPGQTLKLECARAYIDLDEKRRAREILVDVATDSDAPQAYRSEAYRLLVWTALADSELVAAQKFHSEWALLDPRHPSVNAFAVRIGNRLSRQPQDR